MVFEALVKKHLGGDKIETHKIIQGVEREILFPLVQHQNPEGIHYN